MESETAPNDADSYALPPHSAAASEPTDAELERGILDALSKGLDAVARSLSSQLDARRTARLPKNVTPITAAKKQRRDS